MDKKKKIKMVSAVCFVLVCGAVCLWIHYGQQRKEQMVLERPEKVEGLSGLREEVVGEPETAEYENTAAGKTQPLDIGNEKSLGQNPEQTELLYVHICGAVAREGVYTLQKGSRLTDGVTAAGGFLDTADTTYHNLAALLTDGQKVYIPTKEETKEVPVTERTERIGGNGLNERETSSFDDTSKGKVNLNTAGVEELMTLSGIGEAKAKSILQYREKVGLFQSIEELKNVSGIGDAMFDRVKEYIIAE